MSDALQHEIVPRASNVLDPNNVNSIKTTLADFVDVPGDMFDRARLFAAFLRDGERRGHFHFRRISHSGSAPVMDVYDPVTDTVRPMIYMASNDYLNLTRHPRTIAGPAQWAQTEPRAGRSPQVLLGNKTVVPAVLLRNLLEQRRP